MKDVIRCYIKQKSGKSIALKSINGANFVGPDGSTYNAPVADNQEILEVNTFWGGRKRLAFYTEGQQNAKPLSEKGVWRKSTNHDSDVDVLIRVTKAALLEANLADLKSNAAIGGIGLLLLGLIIHHLLG